MLQQSTLQFFRDLKENNNKLWFDENREAYEAFRNDYFSLADQLAEKMAIYDTTLEGLTHRDTTFRIYKDVRFSNNKEPYKTQIGIVLKAGGRKRPFGAYYLHIEPNMCHVGGGLWMPESHVLFKVRKEIQYFFDEFSNIIESVSFKNLFGGFEDIKGQKLSRPPKGYEADDPAIEYLKFKSLIVSKPIPDSIMTSDKLVPEVIETFKILQPLIGFINRGILNEEYDHFKNI